MPKVSVIVPAHNSERFLSPCLSSLVNQTLDDLEVLVVNDHSQDATKEIASRYEKDYPKKVKVVDLQETTGVSAARNYGLTQAQGLTIGYVDSDDVVSTTMYQELYKCMQETKRKIAITSLSFITEQEYTKESERYVLDANYQKRCLNYMIQKNLYFTGSIACWNKLYDRQLLDGVSFSEKNVYEDVGFTRFILLKEPQVIYLRRKDYLYRQNSKGICSSLNLPNERVLNLKNVCLETIKNGQSALFSPEKMTMLTEALKESLISQLYDISNWFISCEDKCYLLTRLYAIYTFYFPDFLTFSNKMVEENVLEMLAVIRPFLGSFSITNVQQEEEKVLERLRKVKEKRCLK